MRIGDLTRSMAFQVPNKTSSGAITGWTTIFTAKGAYWPLRGAEKAAALSSGGSVTGRVRIRFRPAPIKVSWRILMDGNRILNIVSPPMQVSGDNMWWEIDVKQVN